MGLWDLERREREWGKFMKRNKSPWYILISWFHVEDKIRHTVLHSSFVLHTSKPVSVSNIINHPEPGLETLGNVDGELLPGEEVPGILVDNFSGVCIKLCIES